MELVNTNEKRKIRNITNLEIIFGSVASYLFRHHSPDNEGHKFIAIHVRNTEKCAHTGGLSERCGPLYETNFTRSEY